MPILVPMDIKVYTTPTCAWSQKAKDWFKKKRLMIQEVDIVEMEKEREEMLQRTGQLAVPVIVVEGKFIVGFQEELLEKALGK